MRNVSLTMAAVGMMALCATSAMAQREGRVRLQMSLAPPPLFLLGQVSVQNELKLTKEQVTSIFAIVRNQLAVMANTQDLAPEEHDKKVAEMKKETEKEIARLLKPDQARRLSQIHLQLQGAEAFENPDVTKALTLTDDQKSKINTMYEEAQREIRADRRSKQGQDDFQEAKRKRREANKALGAKIANTVLTAPQRTKWNEMNGEPFKGEIEQPIRPPG